MRMLGRSSIAFLLLVLLDGCSLSPDQKVGREVALKQAMESFISTVVQADWNGVYKMSDGSFDSANNLKSNLTKTWVPDATLNGGEITSLAWINDSTSKVKLNWSFQAGSVQSFSSETYVWVWDGDAWKYKGRTIR